MFSFTESVKLFFLRWNDFSGRSSRSEYWWARLFTIFLACLFIGSLVYLIMAISATTADSQFSSVAAALENAEKGTTSQAIKVQGPGLLSYIPLVLTSLMMLIIVVPGVALELRRFHDRNMSGWYFLLFSVANGIPVVNIVTSIAYLVIFCMPGTHGDNKFGPDPFGPNSEGRERLSQSQSKPNEAPVAVHNSKAQKADRRAKLKRSAKTQVSEVKRFEPVRWTPT